MDKERRERDAAGRYVHVWDHAGFEPGTHREWAICALCGKMKSPESKIVAASNAPVVVPG